MPFSLQRIKATVMLLVKLAITTFVAGAFLYTAVRFYPEIDFHFKGFIAFVFLYVLLFFAFVSTYRAFRFGINRYREIMFSYILSVLLTNCFTYLVLSLTAKAMLRPWALVACTFVQIAGGFLLNKAGDALYFRVHPVRDCILVLSPEEKERDAFGGFEAIRNRYRILETVSESIGTGSRSAASRTESGSSIWPRSPTSYRTRHKRPSSGTHSCTCARTAS